ncbi:MAG TPA: hypothetical protein VEO56_10405 [Bacteroidota bacterium]|nr:hypothetical protein [Bacteroidota bacterium]
MTRICTGLVVWTLVLIGTQVRAQDEKSLTRDEVAALKKRLVATFDALGQPPQGYSVEHEYFNLPAEAYKNSSSGLYNLIALSANRDYGTQKKMEEESGDFQKEYQKKMAEAQAKGDYQTMMQLSQELQQKASAMQLKAVETHKEPVHVNVQFNGNPGEVIDPDAVLFEQPGMIALKSNMEKSSETIHMYFDPVALKTTKQLSRISMTMPETGVAKRTALVNATIELSGPIAEIEPWAKKIDVKKVLGQIDSVK